MKNKIIEPLLVDSVEACRLLSVSMPTLGKLVKEKKLSPIRLCRNGARRFAVDDLKKMIEGERVSG